MAKEMTFDVALQRFMRSTAVSMASARMCAEMAIRHFEAHGDLSLAQRFYDAIANGKANNYVRKAAFVKWLAAHSPVTMAGGIFKKDTKETAVQFNVKKACEKSFWEYAPDPEAIVFEATDVVKMISNVVKRLSNDEKAKPLDDKAKEALSKVKAFAASLAA